MEVTELYGRTEWSPPWPVENTT